MLLLSAAFASAEPVRPNIIFVMADDMGWGETGYRGHPVLKTPNLDAMAAARPALRALLRRRAGLLAHARQRAHRPHE